MENFIPENSVSFDSSVLSNSSIGGLITSSEPRFNHISVEKGDLLIESVDPFSLSEKDFMAIQEVNQDMWARGLGEFLECSNCSHISSKYDVFGEGRLGVTIDAYRKSVKHIMHEYNCNEFACPHCSHKMDQIYGEQYIEDIKNRLLGTHSYIALCRFKGEIVGYMDCFIGSIEDAYEIDWKRHYVNVGVPEIKKRVTDILGYTPEQIYCFTAMGLLEEHNNFYSIFQLLNVASAAIPDSQMNIPGVSELDKNNNLYSIYAKMGGKSLGISDDPSLQSKIVNTQNTYSSDLTFFTKPVVAFKNNFSVGIKKFLRQYGVGLNIS
ncbi:hypothetical protein K2X92_03615 [Candidatus Gracilibacteria bacterium]|nr:hypothetical protein [Candidatus Gracilibacteria bacterium]